MSDVRTFEEYKEMIKDMEKEEMIRGLYDLSARVTKQENIIKEVREYISQLLEYKKEDYYKKISLDYVERILEILDKAN